MRALIVDDDKVSLETSANVIDGLGIVVDKAETGKQAIELCQVNTYGVIFMDLSMPELDGYKTTQVIKAIGNDSSNAIIVALSSTLSSKDQVIKCLQAGMKDCMVKPLNPDEIKARLEKWGLH